jgi:hypothetical protein
MITGRSVVASDTLTRFRVHALGVVATSVATAVLAAFVLPETSWQLLARCLMVVVPAAALALQLRRWEQTDAPAGEILTGLYQFALIVPFLVLTLLAD